MMFNKPMLLLVFVCLLTLDPSRVGATNPSPAQVKYIVSLTKLFESTVGKGFSGVVHPTLCWNGDEMPQPDEYLLPLVLLWNPAVTFPTIFHDQSILCPECELPAPFKCWNDGSSNFRQPRLLHCMDDTVFLVSSVHVCSSGHRTLGHDERVLRCLPPWTVIPFVLFHKLGITRDLLDSCITLCKHGMNMYTIESIIAERRWGFYCVREEKYWYAVQKHISSHKECTNEIVDFPDFASMGKKHCPSNDFITRCFMIDFLENEKWYMQDIQHLTSAKYLSLDHTFKVATNIGYVRKDGKWVSLYDNLFMVLNEDGNVMSWQFTNSTAFEHVEGLLSTLKQRIGQGSTTLELIAVDNCCQWRKKLQDVFGTQVRVVLDIFHAVQRVTKKIPKRHPYYYQCVQDLRLVFRVSGDHELTRHQTTPEPTKMLENMEAFVQRWRNIDSNNWKVLSKEALAEINRLNCHIAKGCLSGIPCGCGTNRNEAFHKHLNSILHKSRVGVMLAYALLSVAIHSHNNRIKKSGRCLIKPIAAIAAEAAKLGGETPINAVDYMGIPPHVRIEANGEQAQTSTCAETDQTEDVLGVETASSILQHCVMLHQLTKSLCRMTKMAESKWKYIPYVQSANSISTDMFNGDSTGDWDEHDINIESVLMAWNFSRSKVPGDGDCFFAAVGLNIANSSGVWEHLLSMKDLCLPQLIMKLRTMLVKEWLGDHKHDYMAFLQWDRTDDPKKKEEYYIKCVNEFLSPGFYQSWLGDAMPLALSNALNVPIIIFTSCRDNPVLYITPYLMTNSTPVFVTYNYFNEGHYDYAFYSGESSKSQPPHAKLGCNCGVNAKLPKQACINHMSYQSRCSCFKACHGCTQKCRCKNCGNPYGQRPHAITVRTRVPHKWQKTLPSSELFVQERGGEVPCGRWSALENYVFISVVRHLQDCLNEDPPITVTNAFNEIVQLSQEWQRSIPLPKDAVLSQKNFEQVAGKIAHYKAEMDLFMKLMGTTL